MKTQTSKHEITIIGAGLTGCFLALLLAQKGYAVNVYEKASEDDIIRDSSKRSFNLTFFKYGVKAFKEVGLWETVKPVLIALKGSEVTVSPYASPSRVWFEKDTPYLTVQRAKLIEILVEKARKSPLVLFHFDTALLSIDRQKKSLTLKNLKTGKTFEKISDVVFGADGVNSVVRSMTQQGQDTQHRQEYSTWNYKQIVFPPELVNQLGFQQDMMYSWTRKNAAILSFPNGNGSFNAMLILPQQADVTFDSLTTATSIKRFISTQFSGLLPALSVITEAVLENPIGNFVSIYTSPWYYKDFLVLVGDAAHGFLPFYGLGMSVAFGDCIEIVKLMERYHNNWSKVFAQYQMLRKVNTDMIADLSKESFMLYHRYRKADYNAIYNKLETVLHHLFPKTWGPPVFFLVASDPGRAVEFVKRHRQQRKKIKYLGGPIIVGALTGIIAVQESCVKLLQKMFFRSSIPST